MGQSVKDAMKDFFRDGTGTDVVLKTKTGPIGAHKIILMVNSGTFKRMLTAPDGNVVQEIPMMSRTKELLKPVIEFMYSEELNLESQSLALRYLEIAFALEMPNGIRFLKNYFSSLGSDAITGQGSVELWTLSKQYRDNELLDLALNALAFIVPQPSMKEQMGYVMDLDENQFLELMSDLSNKLALHFLFILTMLWTTSDFPNRESRFSTMYSTIRQASFNGGVVFDAVLAPNTPTTSNSTGYGDASPLSNISQAEQSTPTKVSQDSPQDLSETADFIGFIGFEVNASAEGSAERAG